MNLFIKFTFIGILLLWRNQCILGITVDFEVDNSICDGNNITLSCKITPFTTSATWNRNGSALTTCTAGGACTTDSRMIDGINYSFSGSSTGIQVSFQIKPVENGIQWICDHGSIASQYTFNVSSECQSVAKTNVPAYVNVGSLIGWSVCEGVFSFIIAKLSGCVVFVYHVAQQWYFSTRYVFKGRVFYGIELVTIAAVNQFVCCLTTGIVFGLYAEHNEYYLNIIVPLLNLVWPALSVGIYLLLKTHFCQQELTHIQFKDELMHRSLSGSYGIELNSINTDKIWFKVKARDDIYMTLHGNQQEPFLNIILSYGKRLLEFDSTTPIPVVVCDDVLRTDEKYRIFYLTYEECEVSVVRVLNGEEKTVIKWSDTNVSKPIVISDIVISNYMPVTTHSEITERKTGTRGEWIFFIRPGDGLYGNEDDSSRDGLYGNEDDSSPDGLHWIEDDKCLFKTVQLCLVVLIPIAWLVLLILSLRNCIKCIERKVKNRQDNDGKELALPLVLCCQHSIKPNSTTDNVWINTPIGRKMPVLPAIQMTNQPATGMEDKKPKKKKKKYKNQIKDSSRNDIQQSQEDTENNIVQAATD